MKKFPNKTVLVHFVAFAILLIVSYLFEKNGFLGKRINDHMTDELNISGLLKIWNLAAAGIFLSVCLFAYTNRYIRNQNSFVKITQNDAFTRNNLIIVVLISNSTLIMSFVWTLNKPDQSILSFIFQSLAVLLFALLMFRLLGERIKMIANKKYPLSVKIQILIFLVALFVLFIIRINNKNWDSYFFNFLNSKPYIFHFSIALGMIITVIDSIIISKSVKISGNNESNDSIIKLIYNNDYSSLDKIILENGVNFEHPEVGPLLLAATEFNQPEVVTYVIRKGADVNIYFEKLTPLYRACVKGHVKIIQLLLSNGANPNLTGGRNHLPLHEIIANTKGNYSLSDKLDIIDAFSKAGANFNAFDMGATVLHFALEENFKVTEKLIEKGCNVNLASKEDTKTIFPEGTLVLQIYIMERKYRTAQQLIELGADPFKAGLDNKNAYQMLCEMSDFQSSDYNALKTIIENKNSSLTNKPKIFIGILSSGWGNFFYDQLKNYDILLMHISFDRSDLILQAHKTSTKRIIDIKTELQETYKDYLAQFDNKSTFIFFMSSFSLGNSLSQTCKNNRDHIAIFCQCKHNRLTNNTNHVFISSTGGTVNNNNFMENSIQREFTKDAVKNTWNDLLKVCSIETSNKILGKYEGCAKDFDVFISYRSHDSLIVRKIVEQLKANDVKVWFAEYDIDLNNRQYFQEKINNGIARSEKVICFSNDSYKNSEYCQIEAFLIKELIHHDNILEVEMLDMENNTNIPSIIGDKHQIVSFYSNQIKEIWKAVSEFIGEPNIQFPEVNIERTIKRNYKDLNFEFKIPGDWQIMDRGISSKTKIGTDLNVLNIGNNIMFTNLTIGESTHKPIVFEVADDRIFFERVLDVFTMYQSSQIDEAYLDLNGVNLTFMKYKDEIVGYPAFSYLLRPKKRTLTSEMQDMGMTENRYWRLYSVTVDTEKYGPLEFCFHFGFMTDNEKVFLKNAYIMDDIVYSLKIENSYN